MKKKIILHIGRHKSGTSSLQKFLCENSDSLNNIGFYYPKLLRRPIAHHPLASFYNPNNRDILNENDFREIDNFWLEVKSHDKVIISSEAFQNIKPVNLIKAFQNFDLTIVVYIRDQASYLLSSYAQYIQAGKRVITLEEYESSLFKVDYLRFIKRWEDSFPNAKIVIRKFQRDALQDSDIRKDFLLNSGVCPLSGLDSFDYSANDQNPSIGGSLVEFKKVLNMTDFDKHVQQKKMYKILKNLSEKNEAYRLSKELPEVLYMKLVKKYSESNLIFSEKYLEEILHFDKEIKFSDQFRLDGEQLENILLDIENEDKETGKIIRNYEDHLKIKIQGVQ